RRAAEAARRAQPARARRRSPDHEGHECLLRVQAVLGLLPGEAAWSVEHVCGDLLAYVRRKAMQYHGLVFCRVEERAVDAVRLEIARAALAVALVAHARPDVRIQRARPRHGGHRI